MPSSPWVKSEMTSGAFLLDFLLPDENKVTAWSGLTPLGAFPVGQPPYVWWGTTNGLF